MTTETNLTPEQKKALTKLGAKHFAALLWNGVHHALMLLAINIIIVFAVVGMDLPDYLVYVLGIPAAIFIFRRMSSITVESHDRLVSEAKKIIDQK